MFHVHALVCRCLTYAVPTPCSYSRMRMLGVCLRMARPVFQSLSPRPHSTEAVRGKKKMPVTGVFCSGGNHVQVKDHRIVSLSRPEPKMDAQLSYACVSDAPTYRTCQTFKQAYCKHLGGWESGHIQYQHNTPTQRCLATHTHSHVSYDKRGVFQIIT